MNCVNFQLRIVSLVLELENTVFLFCFSNSAKSNENARLQDKVAEGMKKEDDLTRKLEEKEKLIKRAKKCIFVTKEKLNKKEEELQELNKELLSVKGNDEEVFSVRYWFQYVIRTRLSFDEKIKSLNKMTKVVLILKLVRLIRISVCRLPYKPKQSKRITRQPNKRPEIGVG